MPLPLAAAIAGNPAAAGAIGAGLGTLASGLLNRKKQKTQWDFEERRYLEKNRFKWLRKGAQRAGFNPLTVLGATGGQMGGNPTVVENPLSLAATAAAAAAAAGGAYLEYDPVADEQAREDLEYTKIQNELSRAELARFGQKPLLEDMGADGPPMIQELNPFTMDPTKTNFPVVDPGGDRPEMARIERGPYKGQYVVWDNRLNSPTNAVILPRGTPKELIEALGSSVGAELEQIWLAIRDGATGMDGTIPATVNERGELVTVRPPKNPLRTGGGTPVPPLSITIPVSP